MSVAKVGPIATVCFVVVVAPMLLLCLTGLVDLSMTTFQKKIRIESYQLSYSGMMFPIPDMDNE
jgi:hypothetical protein